METPVKPKNKRTEIASSVLGDIERIVRAAQTGFEIDQNRVDPVEFWQVLGLATVRNDWAVLTASIRNPGKTAQAIGSDHNLARGLR